MDTVEEANSIEERPSIVPSRAASCSANVMPSARNSRESRESRQEQSARDRALSASLELHENIIVTPCDMPPKARHSTVSSGTPPPDSNVADSHRKNDLVDTIEKGAAEIEKAAKEAATTILGNGVSRRSSNPKFTTPYNRGSENTESEYRRK